MGWNLYATEQLTALAAKVDVSLDALESINDDNARPILDAMLDEFSEVITVVTEDASPALNKLAWACFTAADVVPTGPSAPHARRMSATGLCTTPKSTWWTARRWS